MRCLIALSILTVINPFCGFAMNPEDKSNHSTNSLHDFNATSIDGDSVNLADYKDKVLLIVNTASKCGFTSQYSKLEALFDQYKQQGFYVLGFPSNDFAGQEPGSDEEIKKFCKLNYDVSFPMFSKDAVKGPDKQPVYKYLTEQSPSEFQGEIGWNFVKFLVAKDGTVRGRYSSMTSPGSKKIKGKLEELLAE